jgi:chloramphenicol-sensitive protein RarD
VNPQRRGYLSGIGAYLLWGFFPLYFKLLRPAGPLEILAHRVLWSAVTVAGILFAVRRWQAVRELLHRPFVLAKIGLAAALIAVNWGMYIYGVNSDQVVETALGYFITPLLAVCLGVAVLKEKLHGPQWAAVAVGALAVLVLTVDHGRLPWIALTLAASFGAYSLIKKRLGLPPVDGLFFESVMLAPLGLSYLGWLATRQSSTALTHPTTGLLLLLAGPVTAVPLLMFGDAANRIPLSALGLLQYLTPSIQFAIGVSLFHEPMPPARLAGFGLVWIALAIFTWDGIRSARNRANQVRAGARNAAIDPA